MAPSTDPSLWTVRRAFGVASGPDAVALTAEGEASRPPAVPRPNADSRSAEPFSRVAGALPRRGAEVSPSVAETVRASVELARQLAAELPGWRVVEPEEERGSFWTPTLVRGDGATITVQVGGYRAEGRCVLRGHWPRYRDGQIYSSPRKVDGGPLYEITVSAKRAPKAIAREIERRLLSGYLPAYAEALAYVELHDAHGQEAEGVAKRLASVLGTHIHPTTHQRRQDAVAIQTGGISFLHRLAVQPAYESTSGKAIYARGMGVSFEVHGLDPETAAQVLAIIRDAQEAAEAPAAARVAALEALEAPELDESEAIEQAPPIRLRA